MSDLTPNLKLFKYDPVADAKQPFSITKAWNNNWDIIDKNAGGVPIGFIYPAVLGIDESDNKYRYLNGQILIQDQYVNFTSWVKSRMKNASSAFCTEEEWQSIQANSKLGQCGKFVIDDEAGTIRLPAIVNINGLTDLSKCGLIKDESLPAHKHTRGTMEITGSLGTVHQFGYTDRGAFYRSWTGTKSGSGGGNGDWSNWEFKASRDWTGSTSAPDNTIYQDNAPVQQEAVQYPYVICVNTGVEEAERPINNYQVNNTNSYGDNKYVGNTILNNLSWLRSVGQENPAGVHQDFFNWAIANIGQPFGAGYITGPKMYGYSKGTNYHYATINEVPKVGDPVYGAETGRFIGNIETVNTANASITFHNPLQQNESVIASRDTKYDVTPTNPYFLIVDQANQTFILPTLNGKEAVMSTKYTAMNITGSPYNFIAPANGWLYMSGTADKDINQFITVYIDKAKTTPIVGRNPLTHTSITYLVPVFKDQQVVIEYTASNISRCKFIYAKGNGNLYYYVGDTLQNVDIINVARIEEKLTDKTDRVQAASATIPNYTNRNTGITAFNVWKTVTVDSWVSVCSQTQSSSRTLWVLLADENGNTLDGCTDNNAFMRAQQGNANCMNQVFAFVPKNYSYKVIIDSNQTLYSAYEYPLKGVNE